jgi:DNA-binding transcriptional LysR family regulator
MSHLLYLRSFLFVYRHNSISRAAEALSLTQPAVSRHIKVLESRLGCKLFDRLPRGLAATPAGNELERQVGSHLDSLERIVGLSDGKNEALAGIVRVGTTSGFAKLVVSALSSLPEYGIRLDLRSAAPPALLTAVVNQDMDLAVTLARIPHRAIDYELLYEGSLILVCAPRWRERLPKAAAPRGIPLIEIQGPVPVLAHYWRASFSTTSEPPSVIVPDYQAALDAAAGGSGVAVVPECLCADLLQLGRVISHNTPNRPSMSLYAAHSKGGVNVARVRTSLQMLANAAKNWGGRGVQSTPIQNRRDRPSR